MLEFEGTIFNRYFKYLLIVLLIIFSNFQFFGKVVIFDVGQGDAILIQMPFNGDVILIDTGGVVKFGEKETWQQKVVERNLSDELIKNLNYYGIKQIDHLFLSHGDHDHIGEAINLIDKFIVKRIYVGEKVE